MIIAGKPNFAFDMMKYKYIYKKIIENIIFVPEIQLIIINPLADLDNEFYLINLMMM